jgi:hypothetical protein
MIVIVLGVLFTGFEVFNGHFGVFGLKNAWFKVSDKPSAVHL